MLLRLHGALNVAALKAVYEDAERVHLVMELCRGGELLARTHSSHYSERTVQSLHCKLCAAGCVKRTAHAYAVLQHDLQIPSIGFWVVMCNGL